MKNFVIGIISIILLCAFASCRDNETRTLFTVVNLSNGSICIDITTTQNKYNPIKERIYLQSNEWWTCDEPESIDLFNSAYFPGPYSGMKFVVLPCDDKMNCIENDTLEVIEMTIKQFDLLHRCLYYPLPEQDREVLENTDSN